MKWDDFTVSVFLEALEGCIAWEWLHDPNVAGELNTEKYLELAKLAGYPESLAQKAATAHGLERLRKELEV